LERTSELRKKTEQMRTTTEKLQQERAESLEKKTEEVQKRVLQSEIVLNAAKMSLERRAAEKKSAAHTSATLRKRRLAQLAQLTEDKISARKKERENFQTEAEKRKERLMLLKNESVKRLKETTAFATALHERQTELQDLRRAKSIEEARKRIEAMEACCL